MPTEVSRTLFQIQDQTNKLLVMHHHTDDTIPMCWPALSFQLCWPSQQPNPPCSPLELLPWREWPCCTNTLLFRPTAHKQQQSLSVMHLPSPFSDKHSPQLEYLDAHIIHSPVVSAGSCDAKLAIGGGTVHYPAVCLQKAKLSQICGCTG